MRHNITTARGLSKPVRAFDNTFIKVGTIAKTMIGLLTRELVIARTVWTDAVGGAEFVGALDDTVTIRVPAIGQPARTRTLRGGTPITNDELAEFAIAVALTTDVYKGVPITDEELTLDIKDFARQILNPQTGAVAEGVEDQLVAAIEGASYETALPIDEDDPFLTFIDARTALNDANVPRGRRTMLVGSEVEAAVLKSDRLDKHDPGSPGVDAFSEARVGRMAGFDVIGSNGIASDKAYAYHRTAFVLATRAPAIPEGAKMGQGIELDGIAARWLRDYDYVNTTDRSLVNTWVGTAVVTDPDDPSDPDSDTSVVRAVELTLGGS